MDIKKWSADRVASDNRRREEISKNLAKWDEKAEKGGINQYDISKREEWILDLLQLDRLRNEDMKQKCRLRWAVEVDKNSRFFHFILKNRYAKSSIKGIHVNGSWVESPGEIEQAALDYYAARFKESNTQRPLSKNQSGKKLSFRVGIPVSEGISVAFSLGCAHGIIPFIYIGLPVGRRMRLINGWQRIINRLGDRLSLWKAKSLSVGGRFTLIKSVLEEQALWQTVIRELYKDDGGFDSHRNSQGESGVWSNIIKAIKKTKVLDLNFKNSFVHKVADGENTSFWHDA
ncbi:hypothetical protein Tco_0682559 [Tanacetum coccineum]|uniref:Reverse transcriptase n=1 Tax=Tanacetum coccineum TaxID=301880 RepID=A0ABQ4XRT2_9ASTR